MFFIKKKKLYLLATVLAAALFLCACAKSGEPAQKDPGEIEGFTYYNFSDYGVNIAVSNRYILLDDAAFADKTLTDRLTESGFDVEILKQSSADMCAMMLDVENRTFVNITSAQSNSKQATVQNKTYLSKMKKEIDKALNYTDITLAWDKDPITEQHGCNAFAVSEHSRYIDNENYSYISAVTFYGGKSYIVEFIALPPKFAAQTKTDAYVTLDSIFFS